MTRQERFNELESAYGIMQDEQVELIKNSGNMVLHPTYKKWIKLTQLIDTIWSKVEVGDLSQSKAREMTALAIQNFTPFAS